MLQERPVDCPGCGARFTALIDASEADCEYVQDCEVCCRPLRFILRADPVSGDIALSALREDDT